MSTEKKNSSPGREINELKLGNLQDMLQILGLIESAGKYFNPSVSGKASARMSGKTAGDILFHFSEDSSKGNLDRTFRQAKKLYNQFDRDFHIIGDKRGSYFVRKKDLSAFPKDLKKSPVYRMLLIFSLAFSGKEKSVHWDILHQILEQEYPLAFITFLSLAIKFSFLVKIKYKKDRLGKTEIYSNTVPVKIVYRDGHWVLIIWQVREKKWIQLLLHSIEEVSAEGDRIKQIDLTPIPVPPFSVSDFYKSTFSIAKLDGVTPAEFFIRVPKENRKAVMKRRKEGTWEEKEDHFIWKVTAYDEMEVLTYVFKWNGLLQIIGPDKAREIFRERLKKLLSIHS